MNPKNSILAIAFVVAVFSQICIAAPPAALPTFKSKAELRMTDSTNQTKTVTDRTNVFYTGRPYLAESNKYLYKYRSYDAQMNRWTSIDPSGFPDGANNIAYRATPTFELDYEGRVTLAVTDDGNGAPANHANDTFTWTWQIYHDGNLVASDDQGSHTAQYVNDHISNYAGLTLRGCEKSQLRLDLASLRAMREQEAM